MPLRSALRLILMMLLPMAAFPARDAQAFSYVFAGQIFGVQRLSSDIVAHPGGYDGTGGALTISVGIDPGSTHAAEMVTPTKNVIATWNALNPTTGNIVLNGANNVPSGEFDFQSQLLHEMGHALGLQHSNLGSESGLSGNDRNYTRTTNGTALGIDPNDFDLDPGSDGIIGSADDVRGDDVNLHWFRKSNNNPFTNASVFDSTTYSRDTADLPAGDNFSANGDRLVAGALGFANTEAVMQSGASTDEAQRELGHDDVAGIRYAMSGLDEVEGNADDYTFTLMYAGLDASADIVIDFDNAQTGFAETALVTALFIGATDHVQWDSADIVFNDANQTWFFNTESAAVPEPSTVALCSLSSLLAGVSWLRRRRRRRVRDPLSEGC